MQCCQLAGPEAALIGKPSLPWCPTLLHLVELTGFKRRLSKHRLMWQQHLMTSSGWYQMLSMSIFRFEISSVFIKYISSWKQISQHVCIALQPAALPVPAKQLLEIVTSSCEGWRLVLAGGIYYTMAWQLLLFLEVCESVQPRWQSNSVNICANSLGCLKGGHRGLFVLQGAFSVFICWEVGVNWPQPEQTCIKWHLLMLLPAFPASFKLDTHAQ